MENFGQLDPRLDEVGRKLDDVLVNGDRPLKKALLDVQVDGLLVNLGSFVVLTEPNIHLGHTKPCAGVLRIFLNGVLEFAQGLFETAPLQILLSCCEVFVFLRYHLM